MASVIEEILQAVFDSFPEEGAPSTFVGERHLGEHLAPNTIVAVPLGAQQIDTTNSPGPRQDTDDTGPFVARALYTRWFNVRLVFFGEDFETCETLYLDTLKAIRKLYHNSIRFSNEIWVDQQPEADGYYKAGPVIELTATFEIPIWDRKRYLKTVQSITSNCTPVDPPETPP